MATSTTKTNKPLNPRGNDQSPKGYNRAELYTGKALDFDGVNDYVDLDGFTMAGNVATICFYAQFDNDGYLLDLNPNRLVIKNHNTQGFQVYNNNAWTVYDTTDMTTMGFYVIVSDGTTQRAYYNGHQLSGDKTITAIDFSAITEFKLGSYHQTGSPWYNGKIAGFKIFNTALTAAQVSDLYNNPEKIVPTGVEDTALKLWLPMMEGAGTTAYDGSGNGNHGTISGATWTHGVGAPVAQTAVIDWNKGVNVISDSEDLTQWDTLVLGTGSVSVTANYAEAPNGTQTADRVQASAGIGYGLKSRSAASSVTGDYVVGIWAKSNTGSSQNVAIYGRNNVSNVVVVTTEWTQIVKPSSGTSNFINVGATSSSDANVDVLLWGGQMEQNTTTLGPYIPTLSTAQTTPVLLPQGLTSGRDITGVNLFENVRKQGALNLDGNSWAEVHDNASLDLTTSLSLEVWCYPTADGTSSGRELIGKFISGSIPYQCYALQYEPGKFGFGIGATDNTWEVLGSTTGKAKENWYHVVATYDGATRKIYINGVQDASGNYTKTPQTTDENIAIGRWLGQAVGGTNTFFGPIAQPRIYNRALTAEEVERNYNAGKNIYK